jgi:xanthine dehydrogenase YagR molybdenum-binding subunit
MAKIIGKETSRVDGVAKVTGRARYAAEFQAPNLAYGFLAQSAIAKGRIKAVDTSEADKSAGVIRVFTHKNMPKLPFTDPKDKDGLAPKGGAPFRPLASDRIFFSGQPVALVVAETFEQARCAARLLKFSYESEAPVTRLEDARAQAYRAEGSEAPAEPRGNPEEALRSAPVKIEAEYTIPIEHHNPMEPHGSVAHWQNGRLTIYDKTQWVFNVRKHLASIFGIPEADVTVISPFVGGAFGSALRPNHHPMLAAMAAREIDRPVKLVLTRQQMFTGHGYRPYTIQKVRLGADKSGKLTALIHQIVTNTSSYEDYSEDTVLAPRTMYACPNLLTDYKVAKTDLATPLAMRAPGAVSKMFAIESAMDELAYALKMDPLELRLVNYAETDPDSGKPFSSKALRECYQQGAEKFGWKDRKFEPRSMRDGRLLVGWGMATGAWGAAMQGSSVRVILKADGTAVVQSAASDMGPGTYTTITMIAAETLGLPIEKVKFELGHTDLPQAPVHGGSWTTASVGSAVQGGCQAALKSLVAQANRDPGSPFQNMTADKLAFDDGRVVVKGEPRRSLTYGEILRRAKLDHLVENHDGKPSPERDKYSISSHGAQFVEVKVDEDLGIVRVTRIVGAAASGRVINPKTSHSQEMGAAVFGIGMALTEQTKVDHRYGRIVTPNLASYHVPVNADVHSIDMIFAEEDDKIVNPLGVKGMGELGLVGMPAAIANAVFHATGKRFRSLPITPDKLL